MGFEYRNLHVAGDPVIKVQFRSADGIRMNGSVPKLSMECWRMCTRILRLNGEDRFEPNMTPTVVARKYVLWTQLKSGRYVYREDL